MSKELSWTTHILCNYLLIGYMIPSCYDELIEYHKGLVADNMELLLKAKEFKD